MYDVFLILFNIWLISCPELNWFTENWYVCNKSTIEIYHPDNPDAAASFKIIQTLTNLPAKEAWEFYGQLYKVGVQFVGPGAEKLDAVKVAAIALGWPEWQLESEKDKTKNKGSKNKSKYGPATKYPSTGTGGKAKYPM